MTAIARYTPSDAPALIALWNRALGDRFPLTERLWRQNVDDDPNYQPGDGLVLRDDSGTIIGFALTRIFRQFYRYPAMTSAAGTGWLLALVIAPEWSGRGHGSALLAAAEAALHQAGAERCDLGGAVGHFLPGPPAGDRRALRFWQRHGYAPERQVHDLRLTLSTSSPAVALAPGWRVAPGRVGQEEAILDFVAATFPGRWHYALADTFARGGSATDVTLLLAPATTIAGFLVSWRLTGPFLGPALHWFPALTANCGGIGPLGIAAPVRGQGLGLALVAGGIQDCFARGAVDLVVDWTDLLDFYGRLGFEPWRSYWRCTPKDLTRIGYSHSPYRYAMY